MKIRFTQPPMTGHELDYIREAMQKGRLMGNGDFKLPKERLAKVTAPTLVIDGGTTPWLSHAADAVADTLPNAQRYTIAGQPHNVADEAMAPVLVEYFQA